LARDFGPAIPAIRLDSGDLGELSKQVRRILDQAGMTRTRIFASGDLNEYRIAELLAGDAQIDSFGVGTELATSKDAPALAGVYKLVGLEENGKVSGRIKLSRDKATYPGAKQVWRLRHAGGNYIEDLITLAEEAAPPAPSAGQTWQPLLEPVMFQGRSLKLPSRRDTSAPEAFGDEAAATRLKALNQSRELAATELTRLSAPLLALDHNTTYSVGLSAKLTLERDRLERLIGGTVQPLREMGRLLSIKPS
jgi:putative nicotinate phosphoribosyltransferase